MWLSLWTMLMICVMQSNNESKVIQWMSTPFSSSIYLTFPPFILSNSFYSVVWPAAGASLLHLSSWNLLLLLVLLCWRCWTVAGYTLKMRARTLNQHLLFYDARKRMRTKENAVNRCVVVWCLADSGLLSTHVLRPHNKLNWKLKRKTNELEKYARRSICFVNESRYESI